MNGVIGLIFDQDQKRVLLIKRRDIPIWVLAGGGIDEDETPEQAVIREVFEETGLKTKIIRKVAEYSYSNSKRKSYLFLCEALSGELTTGPETKDINYFLITALPEPHHPIIFDCISDTLLNSNDVIKKTIKPMSAIQVLKNSFKYPVVVLRYFLVKIGLRINT